MAHNPRFSSSAGGPCSAKQHSRRLHKRKTICIVRPNTSFEVSQMVEGVIRGLALFLEDLCIISVAGDNNSVGLKETLTCVCQKNRTIDLIISLGDSSTQIACEVIQELSYDVPVFFMVTSEKSVKQIMLSVQPSMYVTGVVSIARDYQPQFDSFFSAVDYNHKKKVLVPRTCFSRDLTTLKKDIDDICKTLHKYDIRVEVVDIPSYKDLYEKMNSHLGDSGMIALPRDTILDTYTRDFVKLANERKIPLFASSLEAVNSGAAFSFGYPAIEFLKQITAYAKPLLTERRKKLPHIPLIYDDSWHGILGVNREAAQQQGIQLNTTQLFVHNDVFIV